MNEAPLISVLMPAYNAEKFIEAAVQSMLDQTYSNWELLILNDGSTDSTGLKIGTYSDKRIRTFEQEENQGYLKSCNELFDLASGAYLTFLDADDLCSPSRLETCVSAFNNNSALDFLTTDHLRIDEFGKTVSQHRVLLDYETYASDPSYYPTICCATVFLKKTLLTNVGKYHPFFDGIGGEDYHWLFRLARTGKGIHLQGQDLYLYRKHPNQIQQVNQEPLKYFVADIDKEIRKALIDSKIDLLEHPNSLKKRWQEKVNSQPSELQFRIANSLLNRNLSKEAFVNGIKATLLRPFSLTSWHRLAYLSYSILMR